MSFQFMQPVQSIQLEAVQIRVSRLASLWSRGVGIAVQTGASLEALLCQQLSIAPDYLQNRIQTIIVNGRAVDEPAGLAICEGDVIALSTAMPGLVGSTLRKGGHLLAMRAEISQNSPPPAEQSRQTGTGIVTLKLFNLVAREIGPQILAQGIWLSGRDAADLMKNADLSAKLLITAESTDWVEIRVPIPNSFS